MVLKIYSGRSDDFYIYIYVYTERESFSGVNGEVQKMKIIKDFIQMSVSGLCFIRIF